MGLIHNSQKISGQYWPSGFSIELLLSPLFFAWTQYHSYLVKCVISLIL